MIEKKQQGVTKNKMTVRASMTTEEYEKENINMWEFIIGVIDGTNNADADYVFKAKNPKRYIQLKT